MSVKEIEAAISKLPKTDVAELMAWLAEYDAELWDRQIADDLDTGRLDALLGAVDTEIAAGHAQPL